MDIRTYLLLLLAYGYISFYVAMIGIGWYVAVMLMVEITKREISLKSIFSKD